jgi:hypothetical protein
VSRALSNDGRDSLYAPQTDEVWLQLLTIAHPDLVTPIRLTNNSEDIVSDGETFTAWRFPPILPGETDGELPALELSLDNVTQAFTAAVRSISSPFTVTAEIIRAEDPDTIEAGPFVYESRSIRYDAQTMIIELGSEAIMSEPFPSDLVTPTTNPGLGQAVDR